MSMSSLFRPLLLLFCFLGASSLFAASPYLLEADSSYHSSSSFACVSSWNKYASTETGVFYGVTKTYGEVYNLISAKPSTNNQRASCAYTVSYKSNGQTFSNQTFNICGGINCWVQILPDCSSGQTEFMQFPLGRVLPDSSFQDFGFPYPTSVCFAGCNATFTNSSDPYTLPESEDTTITYSDLTFTKDSTTCSSSSSAPSPPDMPPAPEPEPDPCAADPASCESGGGDTGGGDTGGGDTGGGDTGGGDTGGGGTGGDDTTVDPTPGAGTEPGEPGTGTGDSVASGMACDQPTVCQGDAIQCAILSQQKAQRCADVESEDYAAQEGAIKSLVDGPEFELEETQVAAPSLLDQHGRFLPSSSCPPPESFSLSSNGGHSFQFSYEPICTMASDLSWLIVAFATLSAALYIGRSFGGG